MFLWKMLKNRLPNVTKTVSYEELSDDQIVSAVMENDGENIVNEDLHDITVLYVLINNSM